MKQAVIRAGGLSGRVRPRALVVALGCALAACAVAIVLIGSGDFKMSPLQVVQSILGNGDPAQEFIVTKLRLPRAGTALAVGAGLGLAGALFQSLTRNPLGSPDILGFAQGSAAGALIMIVVVGGGTAAVAAGSVAGALLAGLVIYALAGRHGVHGQRLVLFGIGVAAIITGLNGYLLTQAKIFEAADAMVWLTGSLDGSDWGDSAPLLIGLAVLAPLIMIGFGRPLRMLEMGDESARAVGVPVALTRGLMLGTAVLLTALASAAAGPVSFIALTAPQLARRLTRTTGPNLLPSLCMGAVLMVAADWTGQHILPGRQLPVGVITGLLGGGYLVWLLVRERKTGRL